MDSYSLTILVALFIGLMVIVVQLDRLRRDRARQFDASQQVLLSCVQAIQNAQSKNETVLQENLQHFIASIEALGAQLSSESDKASLETQKTLLSIGQTQVERVEWMTNRLRETLESGFKSNDSCSVDLGKLLSERIGKESQEIQRANESAVEAQAGKITKAIVDLKASLEESVNFERR